MNHLGQYNLLWQTPPLCLTGLSDDDPACVEELLKDLSGQWDVLLILQNFAVNSRAASNFLKKIVFPQEHWTLTQLIRLAEDKFESVRELVLKNVQAYAHSLISTLFVERSFNGVRRVTKRTQSQRLGPQGIWHSVATQEFDKINRPSLKRQRSVE